MTAPVIMVLGTASSVGKSVLVTALCRLARQRGLRVAPFKAQNMSNNAAVTADGREIARSVAVQAAAAQIEPTVEMNPILIKPEGQRRSQIVVEGRPWRTLDALDFWRRKEMLWEIVTRNLDALRARCDLVIAEGAGSPVELNLKAGDIVNMRVARYVGARCVLVGDIDTGGIFAQLLGTLMLLEPEERELVQGLLVNRFRGDPALFEDGVRILEQRSGLPVLGVIPWFEDLHLPEEDAVALERGNRLARDGLTIAVIHLPAIANFDDFDPLAREPGVTLRYITHPDDLSDAVAVILPGTKHTLAARRWLRERGFDVALHQFPGSIVGICGGYQLLGERISDPLGVEGQGGDEPGLGLLPVETIFSAAKLTVQADAVSRAPWAVGARLHGYEIHMGRTRSIDADRPLITVTQRGADAVEEHDGHISKDGRVWGCYLHGIFANDAFRRGWLQHLGWHPGEELNPSTDPFDHLAQHVAAAIGEKQVRWLFDIG
ncbi:MULTISPECIES: cobyric acid synthase [Roseiflexus]|jgi:adenosylcobyric acid synthase|uniref:Cobyric acid synthase n=1 Tax=Roseiflexus castenholzii (strain DSM 13941 / HLO8) TaxID=383372 RepID=COBQ_ROSCS|nr:MULTISPECIES: cobyric acid synthase [Roseiflexus]A7NH10.1 RecName: Full=Cobyric acid synthase [Roseiflexus castenholzii DSM 13941]ABU56757.1 cobyric acid synthase CobQ [Roseiflexus castenholzii DSM 13941]GIV99093.1 MAG: cobyric acid synthase [Roseiflexus sp.]